MTYRVIVTPTAQAGITECFEYIKERSPLNVARWIRGLYAAIDTLENMPERCPLARESRFLLQPLRQLIFKSHRIVFTVEKQKRLVYVVFVRHAKRRAFGEPG